MMSRIVWCVMVVVVAVTATGCNCFGSSCRRPSFMEFRSPAGCGWCETAPMCGPDCVPACDPCADCGSGLVVME
jgi:hypothetical protein